MDQNFSGDLIQNIHDEVLALLSHMKPEANCTLKLFHNLV